MASSAEYQKFAAPSDREEDDKKSKNKLRLFAVSVLALIVITVAALVIGISVGVSRSQTNGLTIISASPGELQGKYHDSKFGGIYFYTAVNDSFVYLSITTTSGAAVIHLLHSVESSMTMMSANETYFLIMQNQTSLEYADYVIPKNYTNLLGTMMRGQKPMSDEILELLDSRTVNETRQYSLESLALSQEALLIIEAARDLGNLVGFDTRPAIGPFYLLGLQLAKVRFSQKAGVLSSPTPNSEPTKEYRQKRAFVDCGRLNGGGTCTPSACPSFIDECLGMCGPRCSCWDWACGDCCIHEFCRTHDLCCLDGYWYFKCWAVIWVYPKERYLHGQKAACSEQYSC